MILGINTIGTRGGGCETVLNSLLRGLEKSEYCRSLISHVFVFTLPKETYDFTYKTKDNFIKIIYCSRLTDNAIIRYAWLNVSFSKLVRNHKCDIVLNMSGVAGSLPITQAIFLQNSIYFSAEAIQTYFTKNVPIEKKLRKSIEIPLFKYFLRSSCKKSETLIVQSNIMKNWVEQEIDSAVGKVQVVRPAVPLMLMREFTTPIVGSESRTTFLYIGNDEPYKNLKIIFETAKRCHSHQPNWTFCLTTKKPKNFPEELTKNVRFLGSLGKQELLSEIENATALIMPSLVETVGLPLIEAHECGLPIVVADRPYAKELCGSAAIYFDPLDPQSLENALESIRKKSPENKRNVLLNTTSEEIFAESMLRGLKIGADEK